MSNNYTFSIEGQYNAKKDSCEKRCIDFNFNLKEFEAFWGIRGSVMCFYTDKPMRITKDKGVPEDYATIDRVNSALPYSKTNCVWCQSQVNQIKGMYIENEQQLPKNNTKVAGIVSRIKKVLSNPKTFESKLQVYKDAYEYLEKEQDSLAEENLKVMKEQNKLLEEKKAKEVLQDKFFQEV
jgi:hypothetical protein